MNNAEYEYELFVKMAFGYPGKMLERFGDPAGIANTDFYSEKNLPSIKAAVAYGMTILNHKIDNLENDRAIKDDESDRMEKFIKLVIDAKTLNEIHSLIEDYRSTVVNKYFQGIEGHLKFKKP